jgi:hypothetical protein
MEWQRCADLHQRRVAAFIEQHRARRSRGEKHPVWDFLWEYYSFRPAQLERWSPGWNVELEGAGEQGKEWSATARGACLDLQKFPRHRVAALREICDLLAATAHRTPHFACFGVHEWAMVYRSDEVRHAVPLRLTVSETAGVVDELGVRCSHFDAFRFFTPAAVHLNILQPTHDNRAAFEQPGCIHATMDLYKWSYKFWPWISSDRVADALELALAARELDMRASPYDLSAFGFAPIPIETPEGRRDYAAAQRNLAARATPIRARLLNEYQALLDAVN